MRSRAKPLHLADLQRHHHAQNPTHIRQRLQQIGFCRYFHQLLESLLDVPQLHFQEIQRHQFQFHTLPGVFRQLSQALAQGAACPPHQTGRSPRLSECCNVPGLLESDSSAAFVAAPRTCAAAATPAGRVAPTAESILRVGSRCAAECLSRWHLPCQSSCRSCPSASWLPVDELIAAGARLLPSHLPSSNSARPLPKRFASLRAIAPEIADTAPDHVLLG